MPLHDELDRWTAQTLEPALKKSPERKTRFETSSGQELPRVALPDMPGRLLPIPPVVVVVAALYLVRGGRRSPQKTVWEFQHRLRARLPFAPRVPKCPGQNEQPN